MKTSKFSDSQILAILKQAEAGAPVPELCREHGMSSATFYKWRAKFGGMDASMKSRPTRAPIKNEADNGEKNDRGTLAMARTGVVDSATSQFFMNLNGNDFLNHGGRDFGYAVFGKVS